MLPWLPSDDERLFPAGAAVLASIVAEACKRGDHEVAEEYLCAWASMLSTEEFDMIVDEFTAISGRAAR
jgi:hypothetical protein